MPGGLLEIRKRIRATKNTRKITSAMQLVAASKMRVFQRKAVNSRGYAWSLLDVLKKNVNEKIESPLHEAREEGKTLFILYTSDKGLCGALNSRILKAFTNSTLWNSLKEDERLLVTIGKKSHDFASYRNIPVEKSYDSVQEGMTLMDSVQFVETILDYWNEGKVKKVVMIAPHYKNSLIYYPVIKTYLPFSEEMITEHMEVAEEKKKEGAEEFFDHEAAMLFEPDKERFSAVLIEQLVFTLFMQSFFELKAAEYSSRMIAMQNATDAAGDIIDKLSLRYNKARQAAITQEIAEIVGGSMS